MWKEDVKYEQLSPIGVVQPESLGKIEKRVLVQSGKV